LLARAAARQRELAIRAALGAGRARIIRQLLTESVLLALLGGGLGLLLALWGIDAIVAASPDSLPRAHEIALDGRVLAAAIVVTLTTGIAFGLMPALSASRLDLNDALKDSGRGVLRHRGLRVARRRQSRQRATRGHARLLRGDGHAPRRRPPHRPR
jgi:ABC-type lipoprotein release transport system permease subunit